MARRYNSMRRKKPRYWLRVLGVFAVVGLVWWFWPGGDAARETTVAESSEAVGVPRPAAPVAPERLTPKLPPVTPVAVPVVPAPILAARPAQSAASAAGTPRLRDAKQDMAAEDLVAARAAFTDALAKGLGAEQAQEARTQLSRLADLTIFSARMLPNDPLIERVTIKSGDTLARIAKQYKVTAALLADINGIANVNRIRAGQVIKVVHGPFHAVVDKNHFKIDVYLQNVLVRSFGVGLGVDDGTPAGEWRIKTKLTNPTYYPPRGGSIVRADDPNNPLGERWLGLEGISGEAVGQLRYGIHGTNEPQSIGKNTSLGCIRLHNSDVEQLYAMLIVGDSLVTIR